MYMYIYIYIYIYIYVTGFGKTCIVHTSNFQHSRIHKTYLEQYADLKFSGIIEE